jgi:hypothetical protein
LGATSFAKRCSSSKFHSQNEFQKLLSLENNFVCGRFASANCRSKNTDRIIFSWSAATPRRWCAAKINCACGDDGGGGGCCDARGDRAQKRDYDVLPQGWQRATRWHARMHGAKKIRDKSRQRLAVRILQNIS